MNSTLEQAHAALWRVLDALPDGHPSPQDAEAVRLAWEAYTRVLVAM
ncbi:hypothetical protein [Kitasatospora sp. NPDC059803]